MNDDTLKQHLARRQDKAKSFVDAPENYKVCDQCRSISLSAAPKCHVCGAYRFIFDPTIVTETAKIIGSTPFPATSGTVPRFD